MAEFALGLSKTAVEGTLSLVKSAVEEEKKLREAVQDDLVFITGEFEVMQSFLQATNSEHAANDKVALTLVRQLRTLAFDVEDCVEFVVHLDLDKPSILGGLRRLWQMVSCRAPPLPLDVAVAEIKQLKARVEHVSQRNTRYNHILHGSDDDNKKQQQQPVTVMPLLAGDATTTVFDPPSAAFHALRDAWKDTGKLSNNICNLQKELLIAREGDHDLRVISVWGSSSTGGGGGGGGGAGAGPGMASILTKAYCDPEICEKSKIRVWVKLTHPFNHDEFFKSLLDQFYASSSHQANSNACVDFCAWMKAEATEADNLMKFKLKIMQQMSEQRYLVVLEDVQTVAEWDVVRLYLPDSTNGSRILLSTPQLAIALLCTGEPYQVSELRDFSGDNQFLCAFSKKVKTSNDIGEFYRQLLQGHGVISVWGDDDDEKSNLVDILYRGIINGWLEEIEGFAEKSGPVDMLYKGIRNRRRKFERWHSSWVDVPDPFDLKVFAQRLFLNFYSDDIRAEEITKVGNKGEAGLLIEWCRKFLSKGLVQRFWHYNEDTGEIEEIEEHVEYIVVINGLQSKDDWDLIERTFLSSSSSSSSSKATTDKGCILVITEEETVATHCVKGQTHLAFKAVDLKADPSISALIEKGCWQYAIRGKKGRLFYDRRKDAQEWIHRFGGNVLDLDKLKVKEEGFQVFLADRGKKDLFLTATAGFVEWVEEGWNSEKGALRHAYYGALFRQQIERRCSWVDSPCEPNNGLDFVPLNLMDFLWRLLLDFYSDDPQAKEKIAVGLMEETIIDPIEKCREFLHNKKCLVVISSYLLSKKDWDYFISTLFSEQQTQSIIIIRPILDRYYDGAIDRYYDRTKVLPLRLRTQEQAHIDKEYRRIFSTQKKYHEAIKWFETCPFVTRGGSGEGSGGVEDDIMMKVLTKNLVSVWGISGVGKSTLVKMVYYKEILHSSGVESSYGPSPNEAFAWVDVPSPFNLTDFAWCLLLNFYSDDPHAKESAAASVVEEGRQVPILECRKILRTGKCLVVMDGLRSKQDWDLIKATFLAKDVDATIVVVTDVEEVAMHCVKNDKERAINLTRLNANAAISLFEKIASKDKQLTPEQKVLSKSIVDKCGGLPKVIADIGKVFVSVRRQQHWRDPSSWLESLSDNFMGTLGIDPEFHGLRPLLSWMQSYFDHCSDSIKPCIFYLSIFSAEKNIRLRRLLWRWIAEGYCRDTSNGRTYEEKGEEFVSELVKLSIIQESASNKVFCQINGFFQEYIISRPMEDNLVFALEGRCSLNLQRAGQHLTIRSNWDRNKIVYENIDFSRLRSLTVFGKWEPFFCSEKVNMRLLRVLDLEDATDVTNKDIDKIAKLLTRLKFLSLRGHRKINCLPMSMGGLRQLQTLDIRGTFIVMLPPFIMKLQKLRYIRAGTSTTEVWNWEDDIVGTDGEENRASAAAAAVGHIVPEDGDEARASSSTQEGDAVSAYGEEEDKPSLSEQSDTNLRAAAATPTECATDIMGLVQPEKPGSSVSCNNKPGTSVSSLLSKLCRHGGGGVDDSNGPRAGITVPTDIGNLSVLHTLGVVNVNASCGSKAIFKALKKLTQLRKLGVSGINKGNIHEFCKAISDHAHLKSLSVELDKDDNLDGLDDIPEPPKTLKSLKLYGRVNKLLVWINKRPENNLRKFKLDLSIEKPEELQALELSTRLDGHLRIRPIQDGDLDLHRLGWRFTRIVEIQCRSVLHIKFEFKLPSWDIEVLRIQFSGASQSFLKISGLSNLWKLKEVWLKGYTDKHKQYMQRQIDDMQLSIFYQVRPVLKLVQPCVSNSTSEPEAQAHAPDGSTNVHITSRLAGMMTCCAPVLGEGVSLLNQSSP